MNIKIPDFLLEMSKQMNEQENRSTSHPFWQVRCKREIPTEEGYGDVGFSIICDGEEVYNSRRDDVSDFYEYLLDYRNDEWLKDWIESHSEFDGRENYKEFFEEVYDFCEYELPSDTYKVFFQEYEEVVSTHLTKSDAEWFIKRKQHDYPKLYTYVESAYWSNDLKNLQEWIISLSKQR